MGIEDPSLDALDSSADVRQLLEQARRGGSEELGRLLEEFRPYLLAIANAELPRGLAAKLGPSDLVQLTLARGHG
jgi:hypothetical protein